MTLWIEDAKMEKFDEKYDVGERSLVMIKAASTVRYCCTFRPFVAGAPRSNAGISQGK